MDVITGKINAGDEFTDPIDGQVIEVIDAKATIVDNHFEYGKVKLPAIHFVDMSTGETFTQERGQFERVYHLMN